MDMFTNLVLIIVPTNIDETIGIIHVYLMSKYGI